jgi:hypothetical protein
MTIRRKVIPLLQDFGAGILQNARDAFISGGSSLEPGRICMISMYSQIAPSRPKPVSDARVAL